MNCTVCGSSQFFSDGGITFCTECQSQVEGTQTEVAVEHVPGVSLGSSSVRKEKTTKEKKEYDDWITVEAFNHIIFMQVSALIKLGASLKLKTTVLHIWSKYLQNCEIAFQIDCQDKDCKPHLGPVAAKRDIAVLYGNKEIPKRKKKYSNVSNENEQHDEDNSALSLKDILVPNTESQANSVDLDANVSNSEEKKFSSHSIKFLKRIQIKRTNRSKHTGKVYNMSLVKTLSICYLGLLYTEDQLSLCDLIRLVYEEKIPFINILDKLPSSIKLRCTDQGSFTLYTVPSAYVILKTSREIVQFAKLPEYKEPSVFFATSRFVRDLNLPDDILPIVKELVQRYKEQLCKYKNAPKLEYIPHEYLALAFIVVAMKMLFVLDDKFEIEHSKVMSKLNAVHLDNKYFDWKEWQKQSMLKEYLFLCKEPGHGAVNNLDTLSADRIISKYPFTRLKQLTSEDLEIRRRNVTLIKNNINDVLSSIVSIPSSNPSISTSFPLKSAVRCFIDEWRTLPMFKETQEIDFNLIQKDFSSCSLSFNPLQFDNEEDELSYMLMTSLYLPEAFENDDSKQVIKTTSKYWFYNVAEIRTTGLHPAWFDKLPNSFKWLMTFFSKYIACNTIALYREVTRIEKILFLERLCVKPNKSIDDLCY